MAYLLALGYMAGLLTAGAGRPSVARIIALAVLGIAGFAIPRFGIAVTFRGMNALDPRHAFSLLRALKQIMDDIHCSCLAYGEEEGGYVKYVRGANIAGFKKVADAMLAFGVVQ